MSDDRIVQAAALALEAALDAAYDTSTYRWPQQQDVPPMARAVLSVVEPLIREDEREKAAQRIEALADAVKDVCWKASQYGVTPDGDTAAYIVPKGAMHRLIGAAQCAGIAASFRVARIAREDRATPLTPPSREGHQ